MGVKKFIKSIVIFLKLNHYKIEGKKRAVKDILKKLQKRKRTLKKSLDSSRKKEEMKLHEEIDIISIEIKKGKEILYKLYSKKHKKDTKHAKR